MAIQDAIHSPHDAGSTLKRLNSVLGLYFEPGFDDETRMAVREEFLRALADYPDWAVQRAFDAWTKTMQRRPTPGEIVILASREVKPLADELHRRETPPEPERETVDPETAQRIMDAAGFTPKRMQDLARNPMATTFEAAAVEPVTKPHWSEVADPDGPDMETLRRARGSNPLMRAARAGK